MNNKIITKRKHCLIDGAFESENGIMMEGVNLFKRQCTDLWNFQNETLSYY
jgi:hypothetical protein